MFEAAGDDGESSYARMHGLYWLCANLAAEQPLLICIDDAQWADEPSVDFVGFLLRRVEDLPIALLIGTRSCGGRMLFMNRCWRNHSITRY